MILKLNKKETATMVLHMHIMRNSFKKVLKARKGNYKVVVIEIYDYVLGTLRKALTDEIECFDLHLNRRDVDVIQKFLDAYVRKLQDAYEKVGIQKVNKMDYEQMKIMENIKNRLKMLVVAYV